MIWEFWYSRKHRLWVGESTMDGITIQVNSPHKHETTWQADHYTDPNNQDMLCPKFKNIHIDR